MSSPNAVRKGTLLVAFGSSLWATDLIFRPELAEALTAAEVVFWEHLILALICLPILLRSDLRRLTRRDWISVALVGAGASVVATVLFTEAFSYGEPTTVVLLQKVQPLVVIVGARIMLGERLKPNFWLYAIPAIVGAYLLSTPAPSEVTLASFTPALLSIGAATLWGLGTVLGRGLLNTIPFMTQTALRFVVGFPMAAIMLGAFGPEGRLVEARLSDTPILLALALVPGLIAVSLYYRGLTQTPASTATLAELAFPLSAVVLGLILFDDPLVGSQWIGFVVLGLSITALGLAGSRTQPVLVPEETATPA
ncbi:MAG: EamA family transporter [Actinobacteria bacterium]|nr:EamA family transporter [Actinomycetota bacterium]